MDEDKIQRDRRDQDEQATAQRAVILGLPYLDTRAFEQHIALVNGVIDIPTMRQNRLVPLIAGDDSQPWRFGITTQTPQTFVSDLTKKYNND